MRVMTRLGVIVVLLAAAGVQAAADKACLLEGSLKIGNQVVNIKDCMVNKGVDKTRFQDTCKGIADIGAGLGAPPKVSYLDACPPSPQGVCEGLFGQPVDAYYYKRSASDLADAKSGCLGQGGKWR
ncbi:hypothetical protein [Rhodoferax sp.]|uniref:hypothetical protein n=1 Tax=Rhodoferax sp. TaxID=50421 RepID=UPI0026306828|nr:hypothetical protein [Rhodoferax sp.]MDD2924937.1 hypothetical protein [Rhodoferax sp.]